MYGTIHLSVSQCYFASTIALIAQYMKSNSHFNIFRFGWLHERKTLCLLLVKHPMLGSRELKLLPIGEPLDLFLLFHSLRKLNENRLHKGRQKGDHHMRALVQVRQFQAPNLKGAQYSGM